MAGVPPARKSRMAIFGGSFNPVHNGHLHLAGELVRRGLTDEVLFVPAGRSPFKSADQEATTRHRYAMLEQVLKPYSEFTLSDIELQRLPEPSYTIDTMNTLSRFFPEYDLFFLMGMDSFRDLAKWHRATELVTHHRFLIFPRPGIAPPPYAVLRSEFGDETARRLLKSVIDSTPLPIAARDVRAHAAAGRTLAGLVPAAVTDYLRTQPIYRAQEEADRSEPGSECANQPPYPTSPGETRTSPGGTQALS